MEGTRIKNHSAGFTLIELIVVMLLMGLLAGLTIPLFSGSLNRLTAKTTIKEIAASLRWARDLAITQKKTIGFYLDISGETYSVLEVNPASSEDVPTSKIINQKLKQGISIKGFSKTGYDDLQTDDTAEILFYPQGNSTGGLIVLTTDKGEKEYIVNINKLSGSSKIVIKDSDE